MKFYFSLQWLRLERKFEELGVQTWIGVIGGSLAFVFLSMYLFYKLSFASWLYLLIGIYVVGSLSSKDRNEDLRRMCKTSEYRKWRLIENLWMACPFLIYLIYEKAFLEGLLLIIASIILSYVKLGSIISRTIPTPFRKIPFESIRGFRSVVLLFFAFYFIAFKAIEVDNFNLALVVFCGSYLVQMAFYLQPENDYFVWIHSLSRGKFLQLKWKNSQLTTVILAFPMAIILLSFYPEKWMFIIGGILLGHLWLSASVFAKYAVFPKEMNVAQAFIFALGIILFPFLLFLIPLYIKQSKAKLQLYLR